jgi:hypothetical protein
MWTKSKELAERAAKYMRVTDEQGLISLTNVTMLIVMYKVMMTPAVSMQDLTALAIGVLGYQAKRALNK